MKNQSKSGNIIDDFNDIKVMVIGDVMTDSYVFGKVERISPEAPVPVVHITHREERPGGAANVAINLKALGAIPFLCSVTGDDISGSTFQTLLEKEGINTSYIQKVKGRKTTVKTRVIGNNHQLLRVDDETIEELSDNVGNAFAKHCIALMDTEKPGVIVLEDYDKGVLSELVITQLVNAALVRGIPTAVDPKKKNFNVYEGVTLFKPNLHELKSGIGVTVDKIDVPHLKEAVSTLLDKRRISIVMVTLSEAGVFIASRDEAMLLPAHVRNISDVSGAGDTVISVAALCLALNLPIGTIAGLANLAGGLVCEMVGVVPIDKKKFVEEADKHNIVDESVKR